MNEKECTREGVQALAASGDYRMVPVWRELLASAQWA